MRVIEFHFDFSSPYAYFASHEIDALAARVGYRCRWRPMLLGPAFQASGNTRLIDQPLKGAYAHHDWQRLARMGGIAYAFPDPFPVSTVVAARVFWWLDSTDPEAARNFAKAIFAAYFAFGRNISDRHVVGAVAAAQGIDPEVALTAADDPIWKDRLRQETDSAIAKGVFGAPFFLVDGEPFWGFDRLPMLEHWCATGGW